MKQFLAKPAIRVVLVVALVGAGAVAWWLGAPLFLDNEVDEEFPMSAGAVMPDDMTPEQVEAEMVRAAESPVAMPDEDMPGSDEPLGQSETTMANEPVAIASGAFTGADDFHQGSGMATVYELVDGSHVLRLEDFEVTNGPDLHVLLVPTETPTDRASLEGYVDLGKLKGNIGSQNYQIPSEIDITGFGSVVIYCEPFHVLFASAELAR